MRLAFALASCVVLAGCSGEPAADGGALAAPSVIDAIQAAGDDTLRFDVPDFNATVTYEDALPATQVCILPTAAPCQPAELRFDLTAQVPSGAPVELTLTVRVPDVGVNVFLEGTDTSFLRYESGGQQRERSIAAVLLRAPAGAVTLVVRDTSVSSDDPTASSVPVTVEARSVIRPSVLPVYLPVAIDLTAGDVVAEGSGLQSLLVAAPGEPLREVVSPFKLNGTGRHLVIALGQGEVTLRGVPRAMEALPVQTQAGEPRSLPSGQDVTWEFTVPGIPLYVGLAIGPAQGTVEDAAVLSGDARLSIVADGEEVLRHEENFPVPDFSFFGGATYWYNSGYGDPRLSVGTFTATASEDPSQGQQVHDVAAYVLL